MHGYFLGLSIFHTTRDTHTHTHSSVYAHPLQQETRKGTSHKQRGIHSKGVHTADKDVHTQ